MYTGPNIVRDKLVLNIDPSSDRCYPGSGTTVYNLADYEYTGTLTASNVSFSSDNLGCFSFNGNASAISFGESNLTKDPSLFLGEASGEFTYEAWVYVTTPFDTYGRIMATDRSDYNALVLRSNTTLEFAVDGDVGFTVGSFPNNQWVHVVGTASRAASLRTIYVNLNKTTNSITIRNPLGDGTSRPFAIASNVESTVLPSDSQSFNGKIAVIRVYGKALTDEEIEQNYYSHLQRFS